MVFKASLAFSLLLLLTGGVASCQPERAGDAEAPVDTGYAIAAYRTEAQARLDHLTLRIARLRLAEVSQPGLARRLAALDERRERLGREIGEFDPSHAEWEHEAAALDSALVALGRAVDRLASDPGASDPAATLTQDR